MKPTLFEVVIKAENQGEEEDLSPKGKLEKDECVFCHEKGHLKKDCPMLQKKKGKGVSEACVAEDDKSDFSLACVSSVTSTNEWLCDSAYSFHMCFRKE